jgi:DNA-binding LytR/AlgR family response regulator
MNKLTCIIVEDEPLAMERTRGYVQKLSYLTLVREFDNSIEALTFLRSNQIDIVFLDIRMDELSGIQLLESVDVSGQVIITSAYSEYALKGYELRVADYLLKPFSFDRFVQAVDAAQKNIRPSGNPAERKFIFIKTEHRLEKVMLSDILYIEGMRDYRRIHTTSKRLMTLQTFTDLEELLSPDVICRVHKSYMVALDKIDSIERDRIRIGEVLIPVSETYRRGFLDRIS